MKKLFLLAAAMILGTMLSAQTTTQKGISYRYNGKNPRTPLPNVTVECVTANNAVISDSVGFFTLTFNNLKMGDRMGLVTVKKREMMVFNQHAVDEWSIRKEPLCLILCDANEFEQQKQNLIEIGRREAQKKYDRQKTELEKQLEASQIDRAIYEAKLDSAWQELDRLHKHIDEYADLFARIDESEIDSTAQQAMDLFNQGQVDEAVKLFEQGNYLEKLKASNRAIQQANQLIEATEQGKAKAEKDREEQLQSLKAQVAAYKMQNEWEKAGALLKGLADELNTFDVLYDFALYCQIQLDYKEAETYYTKALNLIHQLVKKDPNYMSDFGQLLNNLAYLYSCTQRFSESETMYIEALDIRKHLAMENPSVFEGDVAETMNNMGILYSLILDYSESEAMFLEALAIRRKLAIDNPTTFKPHIATTLLNLGDLYYHVGRFSECETIYFEILDIYNQLENTNDLMIAKARALNNLAGLYYTTLRFTESEEMFLEALEIQRQLAKINPQANVPDMTHSLHNLGMLYARTQRYMESEKMFLEALEIRRHLAQENPQVYEPKLALTLNGLAILYYQMQSFLKCEEMFLESYRTYKQLAMNFPQVYSQGVAGTLNNLAQLYQELERFSESEDMLLEALEIQRQLAKNNAAAFEQDVAQTLNNLAELYCDTQQFEDGKAMYFEALEIRRRLAAGNPKVYNEVLSQTLNGLSSLFIMEQHYITAEQYALDAITADSLIIINNSNLAASLLFQGRYVDAEGVYLQYKDELKDSFLKDLQGFEAAGVIPDERKADVEKIRKLLNE